MRMAVLYMVGLGRYEGSQWLALPVELSEPDRYIVHPSIVPVAVVENLDSFKNDVGMPKAISPGNIIDAHVLHNTGMIYEYTDRDKLERTPVTDMQSFDFIIHLFLPLDS